MGKSSSASARFGLWSIGYGYAGFHRSLPQSQSGPLARQLAGVVAASLGLANLLKRNDQELPVLAAMLGLAGDEDEQLQAFLSRHALRLVALTRGGPGSLLVGAAGRSERPAVAVEVADTVGAGDAFTAALVLGLLHGWPLDETNRLAAKVAAFVCTQPGGTPELPPDLRRHYAAG